MVSEVVYKPTEIIRKTDFQFYPKVDMPPYDDPGVKFKKYSKQLSQGSQYSLFPQEVYHHNFVASSADTTDTLLIDKRLYVTGIHIGCATKWLAGVHGSVQFEIEQDGSWGNTSFINKTLFTHDFMVDDTNLGQRGDVFIKIDPPMPVRLGTRTLRFKSNTSYSNAKWKGFLTGFYDKEE